MCSRQMLKYFWKKKILALHAKANVLIMKSNSFWNIKSPLSHVEYSWSSANLFEILYFFDGILHCCFLFVCLLEGSVYFLGKCAGISVLHIQLWKWIQLKVNDKCLPQSLPISIPWMCWVFVLVWAGNEGWWWRQTLWLRDSIHGCRGSGEGSHKAAKVQIKERYYLTKFTHYQWVMWIEILYVIICM